MVNVGRVSTIVLMIFSAIFALYLQNAKQLFDIIIMFGAGTGLIFILRWFWWRINAWSEISAMIVSGVVSLLFSNASINEVLFTEDGVFPAWAKFPLVVLITTIIWILITFLTKPEKQSVLNNFYKTTQPGGPGWKNIIDPNILKADTNSWSVPYGILAMLVGCALIYSCLFTTGYLIYGEYTSALFVFIIAIIATFILLKIWKKIKLNAK